MRKQLLLLKKLSNLDLQFIEQQLGRKPRGVIEISARCKSGHPCVIKTKPILADGRGPKADKEIFPTLYYLVCRELIKEVFKLESGGLIEEIQHRVDSDKEFKARFLKAGKDYQNERSRLVEANDYSPLLMETGIAGVRKLDKIKCLHAQLAHYLATGNNPVGEIVRARLDSFPGNCP